MKCPLFNNSLNSSVSELIKWVFKAESSLSLPYNTMLGSLINDTGFQRTAPTDGVALPSSRAS